ncbi:regulatory alcR [Fusarium mexicanum]|uniref:Regulatory alcR n=1 Tax=Fusarium mexicanum TaxID=751941 RepID=A0A8H5MJU5_9HYPO|nr:regulatory alcR [Fusarium mexicanum]
MHVTLLGTRGTDHVALVDGGSEPGLKSCSYCIRTKKVCSLNPQWGKTRSRSRVSETGSSITSTSNNSAQSKRKRNESPATTTAPSLNAKYCEITTVNMLQMIQDSTPGQGLSWNNPFVNTDVPSFLSMDPALDAQSLAMSFSSPESASQTVAKEAIDEGLPELTKQTSHAATDALDNSTSYSGSQDFDINNLWDLDFSDINSAPLDTLSSTESPANRYNAVQVKRRARLPSNDWSGYPNFSPSPFTSDSLIMQTSNRYMITESLLQIYHDVLENNLACWLAEENCPYKLQVVARTSPAPEPKVRTTPGPSRNNPNLPPEWGAAWSNRMYRRVVELDRAAQSARLINLTRSESQAASRVLDLVIMAFTTQWAQGNRRQERFSMGANDFAAEADDLADALNQEFEESLQQSVWEQAKRALQDVVDVESYRVIYAELIFGLTQKPWASDEYQQKSFGSKKEKSGKGIKENAMPEIIEIMSQEGPHIYLERATRKIHALKFRFEASESGFMETSKKHAPRRLTEENRRTIGLLYWLAVMFDTVSSSMNERPVALADEDCQHEDADQILADSMRAAQKSRRGSQRWEMELFIQDDAAKPTVGTRWPCSYDDAMQMVAKSAPVKILIYRHLSYLQNALRKRECPQAIEEIIQQTTLLYRYWNMTHGAFFRDLIRHYDTVPPRIRSWFFCIAVPWHLGALMLADVLEFIDKNNYGLDQARQKRLSGNVAARIRKASAIELADLAQVTTPRLFQEAGINAAQLPDYHFAFDFISSSQRHSEPLRHRVWQPTMSNEVPDHQLIKEETMEIELKSTAAIRAGKAPEANNDMVGLGPTQDDTDNGNDQIGITSSQYPGSTAQSVQSSASESCVLEPSGQDEESQSHTGPEVIDDSEHPVDLNDQMLLSDVRALVLGVLIRGLDCIWIRDTFGAKNGEIPEPFVWNDDYISDAWPTSRDVPGVEQCIIEKNGDTTRIQAHWPSRWYLPRHEVDTPYDTIESVWLGWCRAARAQPQQVRFTRSDDCMCTDCIRKRLVRVTTLTQVPGIASKAKLWKTTLQEKRAVVSFRVLKKAPELFSILVVKDAGFADIKSPDEQFDVNSFWKGYGFLQSENITPLTLYLLEICRLEDLDNLGKVEELMFDSSFKRSKDYFVALQVLRIMDEWLDEVESTVEDMFKDSVLVPASMWPDRSAESFEVAVRYVNKQATAIKSRVRKKQEEINSLRDGLFNATSLRESSKAMALNQAIYVFTVVTVLFTPVSFLATFWALPFLNNPTEGTDVVPVPAAFRNSFIIMPILTYTLVIGVAWFVGQRNSVKAVFSILRELLKSARRLLRSGWNLLRKKEKKRHGRSPSP